MKPKRVKELMLPLSDIAVTSIDSTVKDAMIDLEKAQSKVQPGQQPLRAVLVADKNGKIVGKIGHLAFLKTIEPTRGKVSDLDKLVRAGVADDLINSMIDHSRFWQDDFSLICHQAGIKSVVDIMVPVDDSIDENAPITEAIHKIIEKNTLSLLVKSGKEVVGIIRISDLFTEVANHIVMGDDID